MRILFYRQKLLLLYSILTAGILSCDDNSTGSNAGIIKVSVVDNDQLNTPVPGVAIVLLPINKMSLTDSTGICNFIVRPGNYRVRAEVCCAGPGNIEYDLPVNVTEDKTWLVELMACLSCE